MWGIRVRVVERGRGGRVGCRWSGGERVGWRWGGGKRVLNFVMERSDGGGWRVGGHWM